MTDQSQIIAATDEQIPFADLYLSDTNPRSVVNDEAIERLAANIRQLGLIQNPAGLRDATNKSASWQVDAVTALWPCCRTTPGFRLSLSAWPLTLRPPRSGRRARTRSARTCTPQTKSATLVGWTSAA